MIRPFRPGTLGRRLLLGTLAWVLATLVATGLILTDLFQDHVARQARAELRVHLNQLTGHLELDADGQPQVRRELSDPRLKQPYSGLYWQVDGPDGEVLLRSRSLWDGALSLPPGAALTPGAQAEYRELGPGGVPLLILVRVILPAAGPGPSPPRPLRLMVAMDEAVLQRPVRDFAGILALALALLALGLVAAVVWQLKLALGPLERLRHSLARVRAGQAAQLQGVYPAEIQPLVQEFNDVLAHDAAVLERARTQAGNLAHALKTPLSILANAAAREPGELARLVTEQVGTARRQVDYHLARARAAAAAQLPGQQVAVRPLLEGLLRVMGKLHGERGLHLELMPLAGAPVFRGDAQDFQEMLGNLLDNACKWAASRVQVAAGITAGQLEIRVEDDGPGLPGPVRESVLQRGVRADEAMPGSGLGLSIVSDLAGLYGGALHLESSTLGGLRARLCLPGGQPGSIPYSELAP
ncbi:MAG: sensor histidine kinase [Azovibrio sp.]|uniref:sensor histidine kinase n=1 Tax=Azovibrio sp. TaxID=1872673 RepID=UPI003C76DE82